MHENKPTMDQYSDYTLGDFWRGMEAPDNFLNGFEATARVTSGKAITGAITKGGAILAAGVGLTEFYFNHQSFSSSLIATAGCMIQMGAFVGGVSLAGDLAVAAAQKTRKLKSVFKSSTAFALFGAVMGTSIPLGSGYMTFNVVSALLNPSITQAKEAALYVSVLDDFPPPPVFPELSQNPR